MRYTDKDRGKIYNRERGRQIIDFSGVRYGRVTPTDVDGLIEKGNKVFIFYEYKLPDAEMPSGQKQALMRIVDGLSTAGKSAVLFLCRHDEYDTGKDIDGAEAIVDKVYWNKHWYQGKGFTVKEQTDRYMKWADSLESG